MRKLSFVAFLVLAIVCSTSNAFAAQMKYSFVFTVGPDTAFGGVSLDQDREVEINLFGDTDNITVIDYLTCLPQMEGSLVIHGLGSFALTALWKVVDGPGGGSSGHDNVWVESDENAFAAIVTFEADHDTSLAEEVTRNELVSAAIMDHEVNTEGGKLLIGSVEWVSYSQVPVPLPSAMVLLSSGLVLLIGFRRKFTSQ